MTSYRRQLRGGPRAPRAARAEIRDHLDGRVPAPLVADVELLVSELATNSVRHGGTDEARELLLEVEVGPGERVRVRLCDDGVGFADVPAGPRADGSGGYGLVLLEQLASRWGTDRDGAFCVWFELDAERAPSHA